MLKKRSKYKRKGFTLIELLVVISIIIILAGISLPAIGSIMKSSALRDTAQTIQFAFIETKGRAIAEREKQYLCFCLKTSQNGEKLKIEGKETEDKFSDHILVSYDSNENTTGNLERVGETVFLNPKIYFYTYDEEKTTLNLIDDNFYYIFDFDGTVSPSDEKYETLYITKYKKDKIVGNPTNLNILIYKLNVLRNIGNIEIEKY